MMTNNMLIAIDQDEFHDPEWVSILLHRFADYYFEALDKYEAGDIQTPVVWEVAHDAATERKIFVLQNLLLGVNAHINYDLVVTLVELL